MVSTISSRAPRTTSPALSREAVIDHALAIADLNGLGSVSIRRIAQDFGVTPMALYWHVKNKDELLAAMGDRILDSIEMPAADSSLAIEQLRGLLDVLVEALHQHPGCTELAMARILQCDIGQQLAERALSVLRAAGFSVQQSANLARAALQAAIMLVSGRPGAETLVPRSERDAVMAGKRAALDALPADRFPQLVECAAALTDCPDETAYYADGIDLFMAGVSTLHREGARG